MSTERDEALAKAGLREIEVSITLTVPSNLSEHSEDRLVMAVTSYAANMSYVKESGFRQMKAHQRVDDLLFLHNEVGNMAGELMDCDTGGIFDRMTCMEAESIADVFAAAGRKDAADFIIQQHAVGDVEPGDMHHGKEAHDE